MPFLCTRLVPRFALRAAVIVFSIACWAAPLQAEQTLDKEGKVKAQADLRLRFESDWDSHRSDGTMRDDRNRLRMRFRFGMTFQPTSLLSAGFRLRTGSRDSQQSPHITLIDFDDNPVGDKHLLFDKYYLRLSGKKAWAWAGRNSLPFWTQNELFWDDDVTPAGVASGYKSQWKNGSFAVNAGYFALPDGGICFNGTMGAGQGVLTLQNGATTITAASGIYALRGDERSRHLRNGNGLRDYTIVVTSLQGRFNTNGPPVTVGIDLMRNLEDYAANPADNDQRDGFVASIALGQLKQAHDWQVGYYFARIERLAVNGSYAQDDWTRWGSATQTDSSDYKGHEFRLSYALTPAWNIVNRLFIAEALTSPQDGKRFRVDLNYSF